MTSITRIGLRALSRMASSSGLDRLSLRRPAEQAVRHGTRIGFKAAITASRVFRSVQKLGEPQRLPRAAAGDLFDLNPTDEQRALQDAARTFALEQLRPAAGAADAAYAAPEELLARCAELGLGPLGIPQTLGGMGAERSATTLALIAEALGQGDMGLAFAALAPSAVSTALTLWGNADQQSRYLPDFASATPPAAALAVQEPSALFDPFALQTRARRAGSDWVLDGLKSMVPLATRAELFLIAAQLEDQGPALVLVESSSEGLHIEADPTMGLRAAGAARLRLDRVAVPKGQVLAEGADYRECIQRSRLAWCALGTGCAQAVLDYVIPYVNEREAFGEPISHRQSVAFAVSNIAIELQGMRLLTWRAASLADAGQPFDEAAALARRLCADKGMQIGSDGVQLLGGHGYIKDHPVERWYRDLRAVGVMEGGLLL